jgi:hypothetical protein
LSEAYFTSNDGSWFTPTGHTRGPWDPDFCHAGPPTALIVRALERIVPPQRLARINVELMRPIPIPMAGFRVQAEVRRPGRSVTFTEAEIFDDDHIYVRAYGMHMRQLADLDCSTAVVETPNLADAVAGSFPIDAAKHDLQAVGTSMEVRYDPAGSHGTGGPTTVWMRSIVPILDDEEPSPFQRICPLADSGSGISANDYLDKILFVNPDLSVSLHCDPIGEWFCSRAVSHWQPDGTGMADAELFDINGPVGRAVQNVLLAAAD